MKDYPKYGKKQDAGVNLWATYLAELRIGLNVSSMKLWARVNDGTSVFPQGSPVWQDYREFIGIFYGWFNTTKNYLDKMYGDDKQAAADALRKELNEAFQRNLKMLSRSVRKNDIVRMLNKHTEYDDLIDSSPLQKIIEEAVIITDQG